MVTKAEFLFMIQSVNLPPSAHTIQCTLQHTATLCSLQPNIQCTSSAHTAAAITSSVHTAAMYSYLQPTFSAHCSQLQPSTTIYTAAILSSAHCCYSIQCTLQLHYLYSASSAPLDHNRVSLHHYWHTSRAVSRH